MSIFMFGKKKAEEPSISQEDLQKILKDSSKYLITSVPQPEIEKLTTSREIKHLKKQIWKFSHKY